LFKFLKSKGFWISLLCLTLGVFSFTLLILNWEQNQIEGKLRVSIPKGVTLREVTTILSNNNMVKSEKSFMITARLLGYEKNIQAGHLVLHEPRTNISLVRQLVHGIPELIKVTILEGWGIQKIAEYIEDKLEISSEKIIDLCKDQWFIHSLGITAPTLEGFLFPETYYFSKSESARNILSKMISVYQLQISNKMKYRMEEIGFSELQIITLASIIEGEAIYDNERKRISSVYHNRLNIGMRLQADPTIQYIIDDGPRRLLNKDLNIQSPYNTYIHKGLPPAPINNPGLQSILAALYPDESNYIYFVARGDGYHTFTKTQAEHNSAKRDLNRLRKKLSREKHIKGKNKK